MKTIKNTKCRMCQGEEFKKVIDFGDNPLVNSLLTKEDFGKEEVKNLTVNQCQKCFLVQVTDMIDSYEIYKEVDYLYFSSDMPGLSDYFKEFAKDIEKRFLKYGDTIIEIGSNDGIFLSHFSPYNVLGVDPATNVVLRALKKGIPTIPMFFSSELAEKIDREWGKAKVIMGANCIAHLNDLNDLMDGVVGLLTDDGVFVVECNYWGGMVEKTNYSLIYHDHFSYFTLKNWVEYADKYGLRVFDAIVTPAQGGSLRVFMSKDLKQSTGRFAELMTKEEETNLNSYETAQQYEKNVKREAKKLGKLIRKLKAEGAVIAGYGAAAKGFSVLKMADIDERHIDFFVDDSPAKQGKFTPVSHIPIYSRQQASTPDYFFITAPNYQFEIMRKEKINGFKGKFITSKSEILTN